MLILAIDPAKGGTGYAVLEGTRKPPTPGVPGSEDGTPIDCGLMRVKAAAPAHEWVAELFADVLAKALEYVTDEIVVELPFADPKGKARRRFFAGGGATMGDGSTQGRNRSELTLPTYGIAVGAALAAAAAYAQSPEGKGAVVRSVPVDVWAAGIATGGEHKGGRVRAACYLYALDPESLGAESVRGNVADALLLARWALRNPDAEIAAAERVRRHRTGVRSETAHAYLCEECGGFHVGRCLNPAADKNFEEPA